MSYNMNINQIIIKCNHNKKIRYVLKFDDRRKMADYEIFLMNNGLLWSDSYKTYFSNYLTMNFNAYLIGYIEGNIFFTYTMVGTPPVRDTRLLNIEDVMDNQIVIMDHTNGILDNMDL